MKQVFYWFYISRELIPNILLLLTIITIIIITIYFVYKDLRK